MNSPKRKGSIQLLMAGIIALTVTIVLEHSGAWIITERSVSSQRSCRVI